MRFCSKGSLKDMIRDLSARNMETKLCVAGRRLMAPPLRGATGVDVGDRHLIVFER